MAVCEEISKKQNLNQWYLKFFRLKNRLCSAKFAWVRCEGEGAILFSVPSGSDEKRPAS